MPAIVGIRGGETVLVTIEEKNRVTRLRASDLSAWEQQNPTSTADARDVAMKTLLTRADATYDVYVHIFEDKSAATLVTNPGLKVSPRWWERGFITPTRLTEIRRG